MQTIGQISLTASVADTTAAKTATTTAKRIVHALPLRAVCCSLYDCHDLRCEARSIGNLAWNKNHLAKPTCNKTLAS
ncbi:hypothetical protein P692DRAFT_20251123 [Suillus brevipes Sb2]|nr:hypothetical protein P692DRAFT_20251123 [Suillus brevipes Sb2]